MESLEPARKHHKSQRPNAAGADASAPEGDFYELRQLQDNQTPETKNLVRALNQGRTASWKNSTASWQSSKLTSTG